MNLPFKYDIFLSYASLDNRPLLSHWKGWIDDLRDVLDVEVSQFVGENIRIWMDKHFDLDKPWEAVHTEALLSSATMVCVVSPAYVKSEFCRREVREFLASRQNTHVSTGSGERLPWFKVVKTPVPFSEVPQEFEDVLGYQFFETLDTGRIREFHIEHSTTADPKYWIRLHDLAYDIAAVLNAIRHPADQSLGSSIGSESEFIIREVTGDRHRLKVFVCHSSADKSRVRSLCDRFAADGIDPWLDERKLLPGQKWADEIPKAVRNCDVVVVCMSQSSIAKRGYLQKELTFALDVAQEEPEGAIFLIPARLEECEVPERLRAYQWVNLYEEGGYALLLQALRARVSSLNVTSSLQAGSEKKSEKNRPN